MLLQYTAIPVYCHVVYFSQKCLSVSAHMYFLSEKKEVACNVSAGMGKYYWCTVWSSLNPPYRNGVPDTCVALQKGVDEVECSCMSTDIVIYRSRETNSCASNSHKLQWRKPHTCMVSYLLECIWGRKEPPFLH